MQRPQLTVIGTVTRITEVPAKGNSKPFIAVDLELAPREWNGKQYRSRVSVRVAGEMPGDCEKGAIIFVQGDADVEVFEYQGKHIGKQKVFGRVQVVVPAPFAQETDGGPETPPPAAPIVRGTKAQPGLPVQGAKAEELAEDDVPF